MNFKEIIPTPRVTVYVVSFECGTPLIGGIEHTHLQYFANKENAIAFATQLFKIMDAAYDIGEVIHLDSKHGIYSYENLWIKTTSVSTVDYMGDKYVSDLALDVIKIAREAINEKGSYDRQR